MSLPVGARNMRTAVSPQSSSAPDVGLDADRVLVRLVDVEAARLASPVRPRLAEAGGDGDDRAVDVASGHLELVPLADRALMDVAGEDQLRAGVDEAGEHFDRLDDGLLPRSPGRSDQVVVERHDFQRARGRLGPAPRGRWASCGSRIPPDWCRHARTEFSPTTRRRSERRRARSSPSAARTRRTSA